VELAMLDDPPPATYHQVEARHMEIPTAPTQVQALLANLANLEVGELSERLGSVLRRLDSSLGELQVRDINRGVTNLLASLNAITASGAISNTLDSVERTLAEFRATAADLRARLDPLTTNATAALQESQRTLATLRLGVEDLRDTIAPEAQLRHNLNQTLTQLGDAAGALAELADFLRRNPNALLTGRKPAMPPSR
jgi:paraquat-inducible protein B